MDAKKLKLLLDDEVYKEACSIVNPIKRAYYRFLLRHMKPGTRIVYLFRTMQYHYNSGVFIRRLYALYLYKKIWKESGCLMSPLAIIGKGLRLPHPVGVIIGGAVTIGENACIYQNVVIGSKKQGDYAKMLQPTLEDNVVCYSGAHILGGITIGSNCIIGATSIVINDMPSGMIAVGAPSRYIKSTNN